MTDTLSLHLTAAKTKTPPLPSFGRRESGGKIFKKRERERRIDATLEMVGHGASHDCLQNTDWSNRMVQNL